MSRLKLGLEGVVDSASSKQAETEVCIYAKIGDFAALSQADEVLHQVQAGIVGPNGKIRVRAETCGDKITYTETIKAKAPNQTEGVAANMEYNNPIDKDYFNAFCVLAGEAIPKDRYEFKAKKVEGLAVDDSGVEFDPSLLTFSVDTYRAENGTYKPWCKIDFEIDELLKYMGQHGDGKPAKLTLRLSKLPFKPTEAFFADKATPEQQAIVDDLWGNKK